MESKFINFDFEEGCAYCGAKPIFKEGFCKSCYRLLTIDTYILNPKANFRSDSQKELVMEFIQNPNISKEFLAQKYNIAVRTVYYNIKKYTLKIRKLNLL